MRKSFAMIVRAVAWWGAALAGILPANIRKSLAGFLFQEDTHCVARIANENVAFFLESADDLIAFGETVSDDRTEISRLIKQTKCPRGEVILALPSDRVMTRTLSYPLKAEPDLPSALEFSVERLTPIRANEARWDWTVLNRDSISKTLSVRLCVVPSWIVDEALSQATAMGLTVRRIDVIAEDGRGLLDIDFARSLKTFRIPRPTAVTTFGLLFLLVSIIGAVHISFAQSTAAHQAADKALELRQAASTFMLARQELQAAQSQSKVLAEVQASTVSASVALNELARVLPNGTWLFEFNTRGREITISGESDEASKLLSLIDESPMFNHARFASALTQGTGEQAERFVITFDFIAEAVT